MAHEHRFFLGQVKTAFEVCGTNAKGGGSDLEIKTIYELIEYAYMICNCGAIKKVKVEEAQT